MATASRILWKGAIAFGLVHIPVSLHTATTEHSIDFDWIDKRSMDHSLLRETLLKTQRIGVARVVIQTKQVPALVLNLLRWGADIKPWTDLKLPDAGAKAAGLTERELSMAEQLVKTWRRSSTPTTSAIRSRTK